MTTRRLLATLALATSTTTIGLTGCGGIAVRTGNPPVDVPAMPRDTALPALRRAITELVEAPQFRNAHWGVLIVDPEAGDTLYARNAGKLFMPASNQKIITGSTALARLGPDYRFRTTITGTGPVVAGVLEGDLAVVGRGDPSMSDHVRGDAMKPLREIADSLAARGVTRVAGRLTSAGNAFPDAIYGFGWAWDDFDYAYSAGVDELFFNEGFSRVVLTAPARAGATPTATVRPAPLPVPLRIEARTVDAAPTGAGDTGARARADLESGLDSATGGVVIRGSIPAGDTASVVVVHRDPAAAWLAALRQALTERGIAVDGRTLAPRAGAVPRVDTLFTVLSPPLREIMPAFEKPSQNQIGEILFKTMALEATGVGSADSARRVVETQLREWGVHPTGFVVRDGSGLSRHDYVAPLTLVQVLDHVRRDSTIFPTFYTALPIAGVDGTLAGRLRGTPAAGNAHAKTGYIDRARSLSGYVTTRDGRMLIFSLLANNWTTPLRDVERVQDDIVARLAALDLRRAPLVPGAATRAATTPRR